MSYVAFDNDTADLPKEISLGIIFIVSIVVHLLVLVAFPLLSNFLWKSKTFERPKTFTLVRAPLPPQPKQRIPTPSTAPTTSVQRKELKPEPTLIPKQAEPKVAKPTPKELREPAPNQEPQKAPDENLDELSSLLETLPAPVQVAAVGQFPYPWYINNIVAKVERHWTPPNEDRTISVVVSFTVNRDGSADNIRITRTSGKNVIDNLAMRAVMLASPFGRVPPSFTEDKLDLNMTLFPFRN